MESKTTAKAKYNERKLDVFLPQTGLHAKPAWELLEFVLITNQTLKFNFKNWVICPDCILM